MEFESPSHAPETDLDLELSLEELDAILEFDVVNTVPRQPNQTTP